MKRKGYAITFVCAAALLILTLQKGSGFLLILLLPVFLVLALYHAVRMIRRPEERKSRGIRLAVWAAAFALAGTVQTYWSIASKQDADLVLKKVLAHKARTGSYPATLKEVGLDDEHLKEKWRLRYSIREGQPMLVYPVPFMPLDLYEYDFEKLRWTENAF